MTKNAKPKKVDIGAVIVEECDKNENIFILGMEKDFAFLMKRKQITFTETLCAGTMNPVDVQKEKVFFDCFVIEWGKGKQNKLQKLSIMDFPIHSALTEYDVRKAIEEA